MSGPQQWWNAAAAHWGWLVGGAGLSLVVLVVSLIAVRFVLVYLPADYFLPRHPQADRWGRLHPVARWSLLVGKNLLGLVLVVAGIVMSLPLVPGQGLLTLFLGVLLLDFPGKRSFERWVISRPAIAAYVNRIRLRAGKPPLETTAAGAA